MLIETIHEIPAPPVAVWQVFGEGFGDIATWATVILKSQLNGPLAQGVVRTCELASGPITEELTQFDRKGHALTYAIRSGLPGMVTRAENAWTIGSVGDTRTRVTSRVTLELTWWALILTPVVRKQFGDTIRGIMGQLESHVMAGAAGSSVPA